MTTRRDITGEGPKPKWMVETIDHHAMVAVAIRQSHGGTAAVILPPDDAETMAGNIAAAVNKCRENDAKHTAMGTTPLCISSAKALVDRTVLAEALELMTAAHADYEHVDGVCPTCNVGVTHEPDCRFVRTRDALRKAIGQT